jgi:L,D-peptidoglycan transpeptidase YkuD (ErfK/YbiS/YcfS/YnhG family)
MWRDDRLYDVVVVIDYNLSPVRRHIPPPRPR